MASAVSSLASGSGNDRFNAEAASWDSNPFVHTASEQALQALLSRFPDLSKSRAADKRLDVLEIGCGTGLLSCLIAPYAGQVVAVDAADGMIDVLKQKLQQPGFPPNIYPISVLLEDPEDPVLPPADPNERDGPRLKYDLIISHLVLHHIADLRSVLKTMLGCLKKGGFVALTDFEDFGSEAKRFHAQSKMAGVERHGIHATTMETLMRDVGFGNVRVDRAWAMDKRVEKYDGEFGKGRGTRGQGEIMSFPFVLCLGERL